MPVGQQHQQQQRHGYIGASRNTSGTSHGSTAIAAAGTPNAIAGKILAAADLNTSTRKAATTILGLTAALTAIESPPANPWLVEAGQR
jgi:hypothetical protein